MPDTVKTASARSDLKTTSKQLLADLENGAFDFMDFGCSKGGSLALATNIFGEGRGLGLDIDEAKVQQTQDAGFAAVVADLTNLKFGARSVRYVMLSHFLEHLPGLNWAEKCIRSAVRSARDFVFITQPWFDSDGYLFQKGLKLYWSDWHGHPNQMTTLEFHNIAKRLLAEEQIAGFRILGHHKIRTSREVYVHPIEAARDQGPYDGELHPEKPNPPKVFLQPVYKEIHVLIDLHPNDSFSALRRKYPKADILFSSYA